MIMLCPNCKKEMIIIERSNVELSYCMFCEGFWFSSEEWNILSKELIFENSFDDSSDIYKIPKTPTKEKLKMCPKCGKKMEKFMFCDTLLDRCPDKHGIWFDKNEFLACADMLNVKSNDGQIKFLSEVFKR